ncbi:MAG: SirB2 family protein [Undibacterium sp.]|nr:SirB2 family protein [Undibacterium sp.]MDO8651040.1 SirB2 family protein [Undibacterium sp.]
MSYLAVKHLHITSAVISGSFFIVRGLWKMRGSAMLQQRWVRIVPHLVDTILLASALTMAYWSGQYPFQQNWLTAKLLALLAYIVLGTIALKRGKTPASRAVAFVAAIAVFGYILAVALARQVVPF